MNHGKTNIPNNGPTIESYLKRVSLFLEDGNWKSADEYCEKVLDIDPENAQAHLGKLMAENHAKTLEHLQDCPKPFDCSKNYQKVLRFGDEQLNMILTGYIESINARNTVAIHARTQRTKAIVRTTSLVGAICAMCAALLIILFTVVIPFCQYKQAIALLDAGKYEEAIDAFNALEDYKDSADMITEVQYRRAFAWMEAGKYGEAIDAFGALENYKDSTDMITETQYRQAIALTEAGEYRDALKIFWLLDGYKDVNSRIHSIWDLAANRQTISGSWSHTVGLKTDGTVVVTQYINDVTTEYTTHGDVADWNDIIAVSAGFYFTVGLKADGTVVATGDNDAGQCNVTDWNDIVAISAGADHTVGLKADGTVVATGQNEDGQCNVARWRDIVAISAGRYHTVGLKADGTAVISPSYHQFCDCSVDDWSNVVLIDAGGYGNIRVEADGSVKGTMHDVKDMSPLEHWTDIVDISLGDAHAIGLKADGTVVSMGWNNYGQGNVSAWKDIVAISAGPWYTLGLKADGTVVATGENRHGQSDISDWTDIRLPVKKSN